MTAALSIVRAFAPDLVDLDPLLAAEMVGWSDGTWYQRAAWDAIVRGWYCPITSRDGSSLYLLRLWLTEPRITDGEERLDSTRSRLLHYFRRPDDDDSLHDHPWAFTTTIVAGGYTEHLPPLTWTPGSALGPAWNARHIDRDAGATVVHAAGDLHCVGSILANTWTIVRTGPKERPWGFHPPGQPWQYYR
ncbi:MAG: hypothetical protein H0W72_16295, partial [Planctomycetes bacterium]|nr:hypothetical protein [Planctomycetota bacterium]